jgi:uncharacterized protein
MPTTISSKPAHMAATEIVRDAGGKVVGRTRLQKIAYLLEITGLGNGFRFEYRQFGPYSEQLASAVDVAVLFKQLDEEEIEKEWGSYSIYSTQLQLDPAAEVLEPRLRLLRVVRNADSVVLELAATAAFLSLQQFERPWAETKKRKPQKASSDRLLAAKKLYSEMRKIETPKALPEIG